MPVTHQLGSLATLLNLLHSVLLGKWGQWQEPQQRISKNQKRDLPGGTFSKHCHDRAHPGGRRGRLSLSPQPWHTSWLMLSGVGVCVGAQQVYCECMSQKVCEHRRAAKQLDKTCMLQPLHPCLSLCDPALTSVQDNTSSPVALLGTLQPQLQAVCAELWAGGSVPEECKEHLFVEGHGVDECADRPAERARVCREAG